MQWFDQKLVKHFSRLIRDQGLHSAAQYVLRQLGIQLISTGTWPPPGPVLLLGNHPGGLDTFTLMSTIHHSDFYFVAINSYDTFGPHLSQHLLPVYHVNQLNTWIFEYPRDILGRVKVQGLSSSQVRTLNQNTITQAAQLLSSGALVSIFPMGKYGRSQPGTNWKIGLGHLVKQVTNRRTQVVFVKIIGGQSHDFLRFIHPFWRKIFFRPKKVRVYFSPPQPLFAQVKKSGSPLVIVHTLERQYRQFAQYG